MPTPAQIGAAAAAVGGGALGGYFLANGLSSTGRKTEVKNDPSLPNSETFASSTFDNNSLYYQKFLTLTHQDHLKFLVKPVWDKGEEWWKWAFENKFNKNNLDNVFLSVTTAYSPTEVANGSQTALNQACDAAYKKPKTDYKFGTTDYLLKNISDFCTKNRESVDVSEPKFHAYEASYSPAEEYEVGVLSVSNNLNNLVKRESNDTNNNDLWWNWAYSKRVDNKKTGLSANFSNVSSGYNETTTELTALNNACNAAYKKDKTALSATPSTGINNKLFDEIKNLCAVDPEKGLTLPAEDTEPSKKTPLTATTATSYTSGLGKVEDKRSKLVDPNLEENKKWWSWAFRNRYPKLPSGTTLHADFNGVTKGYDSSANTSLNKKCEAAYKKDKSSLDAENKQLLNNIKQFCAVSNTEDLTSDNVS